MISKRILTGLLATAGLSGVATAALTTAELPFRVEMGGSPIGQHSVRFEQRGDELHAFVDIAFDVGFAFITIYEYEHSNHEVWRDGRLIAIDTETNDDGERFTVSGRATADGFRVEGSEGVLNLPADIKPSSYWNPATLTAETLLDTQKGRVLDADFAAMGRDRIETQSGARIDACRFAMSGDLDLDIWYDDQGRWVRMAFSFGGNDFEYKLLADETAVRLASALSAVDAPTDACAS
ncbi:MAG: DUF6134 family protein [Pseudomonadota bacterium]